MFVRLCASTNKNSLKWAKITNKGKWIPRDIPGTAFLTTLYKLFEWQTECKYRFQGVRKQQGKNSVIIFDLKEEEMLIPNKAIENNPETMETSICPYVPQNGSLIAFPTEWNDEFGSDYYVHHNSQDSGINKKWGPNKEQDYSNLPIEKVTSADEAATNIESLINTMQEVRSNG